MNLKQRLEKLEKRYDEAVQESMMKPYKKITKAKTHIGLIGKKSHPSSPNLKQHLKKIVI